jgi:hypothetical protein
VGALRQRPRRVYAAGLMLRIVLIKLEGTWSCAEGRARLADALSTHVPRRDGLVSLEVGLPADASAEKSWDLSLLLRFDALAGAQHFDLLDFVERATGVKHADVIALHKTWNFTTHPTFV